MSLIDFNLTPIRELGPLRPLTPADELVVAQSDGVTRKATLEDVKNFLLNFVEGESLDAEAIEALLDDYYEGTSWRDGTGVPAPQAIRFRPVITPDQRIVTFLHTIDTSKAIMVYRNGILVEPTLVDGTDITLPEPNLRQNEIVVILAYDANA